MSRLTIFGDVAPKDLLVDIFEQDIISHELATIGVSLKRLDDPVIVDASDTDTAHILNAYWPDLNRLMRDFMAGPADVICLRPGSPDYPALRRRFSCEHIHTKDEVRLLVYESGTFAMHVDGRIYRIICIAGDLISVPANPPHWFDAGVEPNFTALRVFTDKSGWTAHYTGSEVSQNFPTE